MAKQKEAWDKLSMLEKALLIKLSIDNGVSSLKLIRDTYNLYSNGGNLAHKKSGEELGESKDLNYPNLLPEIEVYPKWYDLEWAKRSAAGLSALGTIATYIPHPYAKAAGLIAQVPDVYYDTRSLVSDVKNTDNWIDEGLNTLILDPFFRKKRPLIERLGKGADYLGPFKKINIPLSALDAVNDGYYAITGNKLSKDVLSLVDNKKSTGGPLYPFSFEKNPFLKTPIVRYDDGGPLNNWEQGALDRATKVYSNYELAKDNKIPSWRIPLQKKLKQLDLPSGLSNCTLTATQWVDPTNPIMSAATIFNNPKTGYVEIDNKDAIPGNLLITKNPETGGYHTMMIEGFTDSGEPILRYSNGNHTADALRTNISLSEYHSRDNSHGGNHTENHYFRYNYPNEVFLPEITVFAKRGLK